MTYHRQLLTPKLELIVHPDELESAEIVRKALMQGGEMLKQTWNLQLRRRAQVWVVPDLNALAASNPWYARPAWWCMRRFTPRRLDGVWRWVSGWTLTYWDRTVIAIKPLAGLEQTMRSSGTPLLADTVAQRLASCAVHELTHACTPHLLATPWLNEGVALLSVDRFATRPSFTLTSLSTLQSFRPPKAYRQLGRFNQAEVVAFYRLSYWLSRYVQEAHPSMFRAWLVRPKRLEAELADLFQVERHSLWHSVPERLQTYFGGTLNDQNRA